VAHLRNPDDLPQVRGGVDAIVVTLPVRSVVSIICDG